MKAKKSCWRISMEYEAILKDGIPIEKGVALTSDFLDRNEKLFTNYLNMWLLYPDIMLDAIQDPEDAKHWKLQPYQRIELRAQMRYRYNFWTATRGTSKSFCAYLGAFIKCMLQPNSTIIIASDVKGTVIKIASAKFEEFFRHWPMLRNELKTREDDGQVGKRSSNNYYELRFKNGSMLSVESKDNSRGLRGTNLVVEEAALVDEISYNEILVPQLNVARREVDGSFNEEEPVSSQTFITTARERTVFMYQKLIECAINAVLRPREYFVWGISYEVPLKYGVLNKQILLDQRNSSTVADESFARENLSIWSGNSADAWLDSKRINSRRTLLKCERAAQEHPVNPDTFYMIGVNICPAYW